MRDLITQGVVLDSAAAIARSRHRPGLDLAGTRPNATPNDGLADLIAAAARLDPGTATGIVRANLNRHGVVDTWEHLCQPAFDGLDDAVARDLGCADAHLLLSWAVSACLRLHRTPADTPEGSPVLLACTPDEHHTLALEALLAALTEHRTPARMLGPAVPARALQHAVRQIDPVAVVLWSQRANTARTTMLRKVSAHSPTVLAGGPGWHQVTLPPTTTRVHSLAAALDRLVPVAAVVARPGRR
jgi:hypothetical protein